LGGTTWQDSGDSIGSIWNSSQLNNLRQEFLDGARPQVCNRCWNEENVGKQSLRLRLYNYDVFSDKEVLTSILDSIQDGSYLQGPKILSIKNGNICNAKCRTCHPEDSSPWIQDVNKLSEFGKKFYKIGIREINWSDNQISQIRSMAPTLMRLELFGGESLFNKKILKLLNDIVDDGNSKNISLYINTNGSVDLLSKIPRIHQFRSIDVGVSIDGVAEHFGYIRHPLDYEQVIGNIQNWQKYFIDNNIPYNIQSISTVSILNIFYLPELKQAMEKNLGKAPFWNLLVDPVQLCISNMPDGVKEKVAARLGNDLEFQDLVRFMQENSNHPMEWENFLLLRNELDQIRGEKFDKIFPEFADIINQYLPTTVVYLGDLSQPWQGQYLSCKASADDLSRKMLEESENELVAMVGPTGTTEFTTADQIPFGVYYTGYTKWKNLQLLHKILGNATTVYYAPPPHWSDGPDGRNTLMPPSGWSQILTEELIADLENIIVVPPPGSNERYLLKTTIVYLGDLSQPWQSQYLSSRVFADSVNSKMLKQSDNELVAMVGPTGTTEFTTADQIPFGVYYTGYTKWKNPELLKKVLINAGTVFYAPPPHWSDGPDGWNTQMPPSGWSKIWTEELIADLENVVVLPPT
jgi:MoaA/NifB/PqqE/SkfB family radical SAM enzyme